MTYKEYIKNKEWVIKNNKKINCTTNRLKTNVIVLFIKNIFQLRVDFIDILTALAVLLYLITLPITNVVLAVVQTIINRKEDVKEIKDELNHKGYIKVRIV